MFHPPLPLPMPVWEVLLTFKHLTVKSTALYSPLPLSSVCRGLCDNHALSPIPSPPTRLPALVPMFLYPERLYPHTIWVWRTFFPFLTLTLILNLMNICNFFQMEVLNYHGGWSAWYLGAHSSPATDPLTHTSKPTILLVLPIIPTPLASSHTCSPR